MLTLGVVAAITLIMAWASSDAHAQARLIVGTFKGPQAKNFRAQVVKILKPKHRIYGPDAYKRTAKELRATDPTRRNFVRVASKLDVEGMIKGAVRKKKGRLELTLHLRRGLDGRFVEKFSVLNRGRRLSAKNKRTIRKRLSVAIDRLPPPLAPIRDEKSPVRDSKKRVAPSDEPEEVEEAIVVAEEKEPRRTRSGDRGRRDRDEDPSDERDERSIQDDDDTGKEDSDEEDWDEDAAVEGRSSRRLDRDDEEWSALEAEQNPVLPTARLVAYAGLSASIRSLSFRVVPGLATPPSGYNGRAVPGVIVGAETSPMAWAGKSGFLARLGLGFELERVLKIQSSLPLEDGSALELPTTQGRWRLSALYRHPVGKRMEVLLVIDYNRMHFTIDKSAAAGVTVDIPNVDYTYITPGGGLTYRMSDKLTARTSARLVLVMNTGEMQNIDQYGASTVTGIDFLLGADYKLSRSSLIRTQLSYLRFGFNFAGDGALVNNRDGNPDSIDVGGAVDSYLGGHVSWVYRL